MSNNPYATPEHYEPPREGAPGPIRAGPWEIGEALSEGWRLFTPHWPVLVLSMFLAVSVATFPIMLAAGASAFLAGMSAASGMDPEAATPAWLQGAVLAGTIIMLLIQGFFEPGIVRQWLTAARGGAPTIGQLFSGIALFPSVFGLRLLLAAPGLLISALQVAGASFGIEPLALAGTILSYVVGLGVSVLYGLGLIFAGYYVVDRGAGPVEAIRLSWAAAAGQRGKILLFTLVAGVVGSIGYAACFLGVFASLPVAGLAATIVYLRLGDGLSAKSP